MCNISVTDEPPNRALQYRKFLSMYHLIQHGAKSWFATKHRNGSMLILSFIYPLECSRMMSRSNSAYEKSKLKQNEIPVISLVRKNHKTETYIPK